MSQKNEKALQHYFKQVKALFPIYTKLEKRFFKDFRENVNEFVSNSPGCGKADLERKFGQPQEIICEYLETVDADYLYKHIKRTKIIRRSIFCILILVILMFAIRTGLHYKSFLEAREHYVTREVIEIE